MKDKITRAKGSYSKFVDSGFRMGQMEAIEFCYTSDKKVIVVIAPTGCLAGDTIINYNRATLGRKATIKHLYQKHNNIKTKGKRWNQGIRTLVRSYNGETVQLHEATNFMYSGKKLVWKLVLDNGLELKATPNHKIMTSRGWARLDGLKKEDMVLCDSPKPTKNSFKNKKLHDLFVCNLWNHPYASVVKTKKQACGFTKRVEIHRAIYECHTNNLTMDEYKKILRDERVVDPKLVFINPTTHHIHHKDGNHYNNEIDNLQLMEKMEHLKHHASNGNFNQGIPFGVRVKSVGYWGMEDTYDISSPDYENFVANGIIVHNSGKSVLGMTLGAMYDKFLYLVSSKQLQDQLFIDFKEAEMMKGRANYPCLAIPSYTAEDCFNTEETPCPQKYKCVYRVQKQKTLNSPRQILNYNYFITEANYVGLFTNYPLIVADEADSLEDILSSTVSLDFSVRMMKSLGIPFPKFKSFTANHAIEEWNAWCDKSTEILREKFGDIGLELEDAVQGSQEHIRLVREQQRVGGLISKIHIFKTYMDDTWIVDIMKKGDEVVSWSMKPTWLNGELTDKYFFRHGAKFVMMSATFPNKEVLAELLGLGVGDIDVIEIPSTFPIQNRQVMLEYAADMKSMKGGLGIEEGEIRKAQKAIVDILARHPNDKGIIHTVNWKLNKAVMDIGSNRLITHTSQDKVDVLDRFIQSKDPLVFVSPSSTRGVDLYDDRARFTIIAKAPFKSLGDKLVASRVYSKHGVGQYWYQSICAQEIVQACGRAVRSKDDYAVSYILDKQACDLIVNHRRLFPQYFIEAVELG